VSPYGGVDAGATGGGSTGGATEGAATLGTANSDLGTFLVDAGGNTLYVFMPDARGASTCTGDCAGAWPALAGPAEAGDGVDASLVGTATRPDDGSEQVTYDGWPLYTFSGDAAAGDTNGQGLGGNWFVLAPDGTPITG
jgi:predicted lipoprotein with Yx(FWY)xxD motif